MFGMAGATVVAGEVSPEVSPTIQLEGATAEWAFLKGVRLAGAGTNITAGAVNPSTARLRNPVGSGALAVVRGVLSTQGTQQMRVFQGNSNVNIGGVVATGVRDSRWGQSGGVGQNALIMSSTNSGGAIVGVRMFDIRLLADEAFVVPFVFMLLPGDNLDFTGTANNTDVQVSLEWSERALPAMEQA